MIVNALIRIVGVLALRGTTLAEERVIDSSIEALSSILGEKPAPVIVLRVDEGVQPAIGEGFFSTASRLTLALDLIVANKVRHRVGEGEVQETIALEPTDASLEFSLDMLDRQWRRALSDPANPYAEAFRALAGSIGPIKWTRAVDPETGVKHAARMIEIELEPICDPAPGDDENPVIEAALDLVGELAGYHDVVEAIRSELGHGPQRSWLQVQSVLATTAAVPGLIGMAPPPDGMPDPSDPEADLEGVNVAAGDGEGTDIGAGPLP